MPKPKMINTSVHISEELYDKIRKLIYVDKTVPSLKAAITWGLWRVIENGGILKREVRK